MIYFVPGPPKVPHLHDGVRRVPRQAEKHAHQNKRALRLRQTKFDLRKDEKRLATDHLRVQRNDHDRIQIATERAQNGAHPMPAEGSRFDANANARHAVF